jgi:hypothetical protein
VRADIYEQKKKLILGLIWTLILRFQIQQVEQEDGTLAAFSLRAQPLGRRQK